MSQPCKAGRVDLVGYDKFLNGELTDYALPEEDILKYTEPLADLPKPSTAKTGKW
jgi:tryptophan synthase beta chain